MLLVTILRHVYLERLHKLTYYNFPVRNMIQTLSNSTEVIDTICLNVNSCLIALWFVTHCCTWLRRQGNWKLEDFRDLWIISKNL